jgi:hypothetical protein
MASADEHTEQNRSSALSPEALAIMNAAVQSAVVEAMKGIAPIFQSMALTPEKIQEMKTPYKDPKLAAREKRELNQAREQEKELREMDEKRRASCLHQDKLGNDSISLVHNQRDHSVAGVCMQCHDWIHGRRWVIDAPDPETGKTVAHIQPAHKDYPRVLKIESQS